MRRTKSSPPTSSLQLRPDKLDRAYAPTYAVDGPDLGESHRSISDAVADIPGWLEPEDALKLYELAYFSPGPILEIGTWSGKSLAVLASGAQAGGRNQAIVSVDINEDRLELARAALAARSLGGRVTLVRGSAAALFAAAPQFAPTLVFLDGDHTLRGVNRDLAVLERHVPVGAFLLFHDFASARNDDPRNRLFEVRRAVTRSWVMRDCEFAGVFGLGGLFVRREGGGLPDEAAAPLLLDAVRYDLPALRLKQRLPASARERLFRLLHTRSH